MKITKESIKRKLTQDKTQYFIEKLNGQYILHITPKGALNSTFHRYFNAEHIGYNFNMMTYKLSN